MTLRTRFAPTPSGFLHWGNAFSFVITWLIARKNQGEIVLRIDDLDSDRKRPAYISDIFESLDWLGLDFDHGPSSPDDFNAHFSQQHRMPLYHSALNELADSQQLFACVCTRSSIKRESVDGQHPPTCAEKNLSLQTDNAAWRMQTTNVPVQWTDRNGSSRCVNLNETMRDFVVRRKGNIPAYQLASVVDDNYFNINLVVRGADLVASTAVNCESRSSCLHPTFRKLNSFTTSWSKTKWEGNCRNQKEQQA